MDFINERMIEDAFNIFCTVAEASNGNEKIRLLGSYENPVMKELLSYTFNSFYQYYIKQLPSPTPVARPVSADNYKAFIKLLNELNDRAHKDVKGAVEGFLKRCNMAEQHWYKAVLSRNLGIGITVKGVNKALPGLIPTYEVQLAETVEDVTLTDKASIMRLPALFVLQYKIDGYRLNIHKSQDGKVSIKTRSGLPVNGYTKLEEEASRILPCGIVYDGEMVAPELFSWIESNMLRDAGGRIADRSLFKETMRKTFSKETGKEGVFNIFDAVDKSKWDSQSLTVDYGERMRYMDEAVSPLLDAGGASQMKVVPTSRVFRRDCPEDLAEVVRIFHKFLSYGWEGVMVKSMEAPYEWKRTKNIQKMKLMDTVDLEVMGVTGAEGEGEGLVGTIQCLYKGSILNIGTGKMTAADRRQYLADPNKLIGKTIEVLYQAESVGTDGSPVLDFARFKQVRKDK